MQGEKHKELCSNSKNVNARKIEPSVHGSTSGPENNLLYKRFDINI